MKEKIAVLDCDGTLVNGNLGFAFIKVLGERGVLSSDVVQNIFDWLGKYKSGLVDVEKTLNEISDLYTDGMKGKDQKLVEEIAMETWTRIRGLMYPHVPKLIEMLNEGEWEIFLLSGSQSEVVIELGKELGIKLQNVFGGKLEVKDGVYTGRMEYYPGSAKQKLEILDKLPIQRNDINWDASIAIGDDMRDIDILKRVGHPIVFGLDVDLRNMANEYKWPVFTDNEGMVEIINRINPALF